MSRSHNIATASSQKLTGEGEPYILVILQAYGVRVLSAPSSWPVEHFNKTSRMLVAAQLQKSFSQIGDPLVGRVSNLGQAILSSKLHVPGTPYYSKDSLKKRNTVYQGCRI